MTNSIQSSQFENKSQAEIDKIKYRFNGERYSFQGVASSKDTTIVPQLTGLFAFPKDDAQNVGENYSNSDPQIINDYISPNNMINLI